jgi:hypothetical protein
VALVLLPVVFSVPDRGSTMTVVTDPAVVNVCSAGSVGRQSPTGRDAGDSTAIVSWLGVPGASLGETEQPDGQDGRTPFVLSEKHYDERTEEVNVEQRRRDSRHLESGPSRVYGWRYFGTDDKYGVCAAVPSLHCSGRLRRRR